jgi:hypothetical protein
MKFKKLLLGFLLVIFATQNSLTGEEYKIYTSTLDKIINAIGSISGQTDYTYSIFFYHPCFPDFWNLCQSDVCSDNIHWKLEDNKCQISSNGMEIDGSIDISWCGLRYSATYSAPVSLFLNESTNQLIASVSYISIPIQFFGITFTYLTLKIPYSMVVPTGGVAINYGTASIPNKIVAYPSSAVISTQEGFISIIFNTVLNH